MKSQQSKKRIEREGAVSAASQLAREENPFLMALYLAFVSIRAPKGEPKYSDDKYGNRVLTETLKEVTV